MTKPMTDEQLEMLEEFPDENIQDCLREIRSLREDVERLKKQFDLEVGAMNKCCFERGELKRENAKLRKVVGAVRHVTEWDVPKDAHYTYTILKESLHELDEEKK